MGKLFFVRKTDDAALVEQNRLLTQLLASQTAEAPKQDRVAVYAPAPETDLPVLEKVEEESALELPFEADEPYIPKATKSTAQINTVDTTSGGEFNHSDVEKLKKIKQKSKEKTT